MPHLTCSSSTPLFATPQDIKAAEREHAKRKRYIQDLSHRLFSRGYKPKRTLKDRIFFIAIGRASKFAYAEPERGIPPKKAAAYVAKASL